MYVVGATVAQFPLMGFPRLLGRKKDYHKTVNQTNQSGNLKDGKV